VFLPPKKKRKPFSTKTKKMEWMSAAGKDPLKWRTGFSKTSRCRQCGKKLIWGDGTYSFDHKDNNPANISQSNCYLICRNCHGKHTVIRKRRIKGVFGQTIGYKTIKKRVGYKKPKKKARKTKRVPIRNIFGVVVGHKTVKIRKRRASHGKKSRI